MTPVGGCLFCAIIAGDEPATWVLETPDVAGFLDVRPVFKGHVLLMPRRHIDTLTEPRTRYSDAGDAEEYAARLRAELDGRRHG
jgi:histidine triad (HIT) family protein